jgi:uncharacterized protein YjbI with pentapeptide repeats
MGKRTLSSKKLLIVLTAIVLLAGGIFFMQQYGTFTCSVAEINANPSMINGGRLSGGKLDGLVLENLVLKNTSFNNMEICNYVFRNVVFEDCTFTKVDVFAGIMDNVTFKGGRLTYTGSPTDWKNFTGFGDFKGVTNLVLDGVQLDRTIFTGIDGGGVYLKNLNCTSDYALTWGAIIMGSNIALRADNCRLSDVDLCSLDGDSTIHVTNSVLVNSGFGGSRNQATYVENCQITGSLGGAQVMVVKDSVLMVSSWGGDLYFVNNKFVPLAPDDHVQRSPLGGKRMFFIGNNQDTPMPITITGGGAYIYDTDLDKPIFMEEIDFINLRNVKIMGGEFFYLILKEGQWENVVLLPTIEIKGNKFEIGHLNVYNVTAPQGYPFQGNPDIKRTYGEQPFDNVKVTYSDRPFDNWPEVKVPTLQDMGIDPDRFDKN